MKQRGVKIIAEFCQNYKGDKNILKEMIWRAKEAGADYAKVQSYLADELTFREKFEVGCSEALRRPYQKEYERLKPADLNDAAMLWFVEECKRAGIKPLVTIFTRQRIPVLGRLDWDEVKIASYDCASYPMLGELKSYFNHFYISTGGSFDEEIEKTAKAMKGWLFTFLHCVSIYPTPLGFLHLARMNLLRRFTPKVGFSDHTLVEKDGLKAAIAALFLEADVIERHFTVLSRKETKDGPVSINPEELKELVKFSKMDREDLRQYIKKHIPEFKKMIGLETRQLTEEELRNRDYYRGRFASKVNGEIINNWENKKVF